LLELGPRVGDVVESHPDPDDVVTLLGEQRGRDRRVDAAGHRDEDAAHATPTPWPSGSAARTAAAARESASTLGMTSTASSTSSSVVVRPSESRREPRASSSG